MENVNMSVEIDWYAVNTINTPQRPHRFYFIFVSLLNIETNDA